MTPLPDDPLEFAIVLFMHLHDRKFDAGVISGKVAPSLDFAEVERRLDEKVLSANATARAIEWYAPRQFFRSLEHVLEAAARRIKPPERFYLADIDRLCRAGDADLPAEVRNYLAATKLYDLLWKVADHHGGAGEEKTLVFLNRGKIEITPAYGVADLRGLPNLDDFEEAFIESDIHREQKQTVVKTVLLELFSGKSRFPFSEVLARFEDFVEKVRSSYQLYVAEFSFQKVKAEVEKEKLDAMLKLNKVFSDIQNQLLAVPVALVLVGGQMEDKGAWTSKNVLIWLGALVFSILMDLLIRNQRHTLKAVKDEIEQQQEQIKTKYQSIADRFAVIYEEIDARHVHQKRLLRVVDLLVAAALAVTTVLLLWFSGAMSQQPVLEALFARS